MPPITMTTATPISRSRSSDSLSGPPIFTAVAIYDDLSAALRVQTALAWLQCSLASVMSINTFAWSFQQLERPDVRSHAARMAGTADMILVAAHAGGVMTGHINQWLESSLVARDAGRPVLTALDEGIGGGLDCAQEERGLRGSLRQFAARLGAGFMHNEEFEQNIDPTFALQLVRSQQRPPPAVNRISKPRAYAVPRHFGIND